MSPGIFFARAGASINATGVKPCYYSLNTRAADFGYEPELTFLEGVLLEAEAMLTQGTLGAGSR